MVPIPIQKVLNSAKVVNYKIADFAECQSFAEPKSDILLFNVQHLRLPVKELVCILLFIQDIILFQNHRHLSLMLLELK